MEEEPYQDDEQRLVITIDDPRFDDETTLAAKRVVPLSAIANSSFDESKKSEFRTQVVRFVPACAVVLGAALFGIFGGWGLTEVYQRETIKPSNVPSDRATQALSTAPNPDPSVIPSLTPVAREVPVKDTPPVVLVPSGPTSKVANSSDPPPKIDESTPGGNTESNLNAPRAESVERPRRAPRERRPVRPAAPHRRQSDFPYSDARDFPDEIPRRERRIDRIRDTFMGREP